MNFSGLKCHLFLPSIYITLFTTNLAFAAGVNYNDTTNKPLTSTSGPSFTNAVMSGNVGIGTTKPQTLLAVEGGNVGIGTWTAAGGNLILNGNGNFGIGSVVPGAALDVQGTARMGGFILTASPSAGNVLSSSASGVASWTAPGSLQASTGASGNLEYDNSGNFSGVVNTGDNASGNVGLGTTLSANLLDIQGGVGIGTSFAGYISAPSNGLIVSGDVGLGTVTPTTQFVVMNGNVGIGTWVPAGILQVNNQSHTPFLIDANGNVGIGTTMTSNAALSVMSGNVGLATLQPFGLFQVAIPKAPAITGLIITNDGNIGMGTWDTTRGRLMMGGYMGIGTTEPTRVLEVNQSTPVDAPFRITCNSLNYTCGMDTDDNEGTPVTRFGHRGSSSSSPNYHNGFYLDTRRFNAIEIFVTNGQTRIMVGNINGANNGNVGIDTTTPQNDFDVKGGMAAGSYAGTASSPSNGLIVSGNVGIGTTQASTSALTIMDGNVGIGTWVPAYTIHVVGTAGLSTGTAWINASDLRLKNIHGNYERGLEAVLKLHTIRYSYKPNNALNLPAGKETIGFIAQEVQKAIPEAVSRGPSGYLQLNVDPIHWAQINAIQELDKRIEENNHVLSERLSSLSREIEKLKSEYDK
jgi:hypothetical protein